MNTKDENLTKNELDPKQGSNQNYSENVDKPNRNDLAVQPPDSYLVNENQEEVRRHAEEAEQENAKSSSLYEDQQIDLHDPDETVDDEDSALIDEDDDDELFDDDDDESVEEKQDDEQSSLDEDDRHNDSVI